MKCDFFFLDYLDFLIFLIYFYFLQNENVELAVV